MLIVRIVEKFDHHETYMKKMSASVFLTHTQSKLLNMLQMSPVYKAWIAIFYINSICFLYMDLSMPFLVGDLIVTFTHHGENTIIHEHTSELPSWTVWDTTRHERMEPRETKACLELKQEWTWERHSLISVNSNKSFYLPTSLAALVPVLI